MCQFKEKKIIFTFGNIMLVQIILEKIISRNDDLFKLISN